MNENTRKPNVYMYVTDILVMVRFHSVLIVFSSSFEVAELSFAFHFSESQDLN